MKYEYESGLNLEGHISRNPEKSYPPSTEKDASGDRKPYPGFSAKELAARDVFWVAAKEYDPLGEGKGLMTHFDDAIRISTKVSSAHPDIFEGSDRYIATKIAEAESVRIRQLERKCDRLRTEAEDSAKATKYAVEESAAHRRKRNIFNEKANQLEAENTELKRKSPYSEGFISGLKKDVSILSARNSQLKAELNTLQEQLRHERIQASDQKSALEFAVFQNIQHKAAHKPVLITKPSEPKERIPMSKTRMALCAAAFIVCAPFAYNTAVDQWSGVITQVMPEDVTPETRMAQIMEAKQESELAFARKIVALRMEARSAQEEQELLDEVMVAFGLTAPELENTLTLAAVKVLESE